MKGWKKIILHYISIENTRCIELVKFNSMKEAQIAKLIIQTYFESPYNQPKIRILTEERLRTEKFNKTKYDLSNSWYTQVRTTTKRKIKDSYTR